jgi:hypothetical protein
MPARYLVACAPRLALALLLAAGALAGCSSVVVPAPQRSAVEQELLVRSLERAITKLDTAHMEGRRVALALYGLTKDEAFTREYLVARLRARGVNVVDGAGPVDLRVEAFASIVGVDQGDTLIGIPALQVPVLALPIPEIALFKWARSRGHSEIQLFAFDPQTGRLVERVPDATGRSRYDRFTVLLIIGFTWSDLDERPAAERPLPD